MAQKDHKSLSEKFEDFAVKIEALHGDVQSLEKAFTGEIKNLKEVLGMSRAEQHNFNEYVIKMLDAHEQKIDDAEKEMDCAHMDEHVKAHETKFEEQDKRMRRIESRQSYLTGAWVAIFTAIEAVKYFWRIK